jgi:hypothetical protein
MLVGLSNMANDFLKLKTWCHLSYHFHQGFVFNFVRSKSDHIISLQPWLWKYSKSFFLNAHCICELFVNWIECRFCHQRLLVAAVYVWKLLICSKISNKISKFYGNFSVGRHIFRIQVLQVTIRNLRITK